MTLFYIVYNEKDCLEVEQFNPLKCQKFFEKWPFFPKVFKNQSEKVCNLEQSGVWQG